MKVSHGSTVKILQINEAQCCFCLKILVWDETANIFSKTATCCDRTFRIKHNGRGTNKARITMDRKGSNNNEQNR